MKNILFASAIAIVLTSFASSCKKIGDNDPGLLPYIALKTSGGYISKDTTVPAGTVIKTGIDAHKTEPTDVLKVFAITRTYDAGLGSTVYSENLSGAEGDNYTYDYNITTRSTAGTEKYTYTISNRDGLVNNVSLTITTQ